MQIIINVSKNHIRLFLVLFAVISVGLAANYAFSAPSLLQWHPLSEISADGGATSIELTTTPGKINSSYLGGPMSVSPAGDVSWTGSLTGGTVPWARLNAFPASCPAGQYVSAIGASSTCGSPGGGIPSGAIIMWAGTLASIPSGWRLCDGTSGTPDLRARFIRGTPPGINPGAIGGSDIQTTISDSTTADRQPNSNTGNPPYSTKGHTHTVDVRPAYYELAFICKL